LWRVLSKAVKTVGCSVEWRAAKTAPAIRKAAKMVELLVER